MRRPVATREVLSRARRRAQVGGRHRRRDGRRLSRGGSRGGERRVDGPSRGLRTRVCRERQTLDTGTVLALANAVDGVLEVQCAVVPVLRASFGSVDDAFVVLELTAVS